MIPTQLGIYKENCGKDITKCPSDYPSTQIRDLCEKGPYNEICINEKEWYPCTSGAYRNIFCKTCWQDRVYDELLVPEQRTDGKKDTFMVLPSTLYPS